MTDNVAQNVAGVVALVKNKRGPAKKLGTTRIVQVYISTEDKAKVEAMAEALGTSPSQIFRMATSMLLSNPIMRKNYLGDI